MLELASKKKDSYFKVINIKLSFVNNVKEVNRYKFERLLSKRIMLRNNKT